MQRLIMKCVLARTQSGEIPSGVNDSECQAEAIFTVTHIFNHVKLPHTHRKWLATGGGGACWSCLSPRGWVGGERLWATESPNNYEPEQKALREALSQDGEGQGVASDCLGVLAVQSKVMNDIP